MKIILLGAPGAGKGSYARRLIKIYNIPHISTGDLLREAVKKDDLYGKEAKRLMDKGKLVPDELILNLLKERLSHEDAKKGAFIDGFPRTTKQAEMLDKIADIAGVLKFDVDDQTIIDRISGRIICRDCGEIFHTKKIIPKVEGVCDKCGGEIYQREDDKEETVKKRLETYEKETAPLVEYYTQEGKLKRVDGNTDIMDPRCRIIEDCQKILDGLK